MKGDLVRVDGEWRRVVSETVITVSAEETEKERRARARTGERLQTFQYTAVLTAPLFVSLWEETEDEIVSMRI